MAQLSFDIPHPRVLEFVLFCIDFVAREVKMPPQTVYQLLKNSGLLQHYLIENYETLHTLGKDYLVEDIIRLMREKQLL